MDTGCLCGVECRGIHRQPRIHTYTVSAGLEEHRSLRWLVLLIQKHTTETSCIIIRLQVWRHRAGTSACRLRWVDATAALTQITYMQLITPKIHTLNLKCSVGNLCKGLQVVRAYWIICGITAPPKRVYKLLHLQDNKHPKLFVSCRPC